MTSLRRAFELAKLSGSSIRRTPLRIFLTSTGVSIAGGMLLSMLGFAFGIQQQIQEPLLKFELLQRIDVTSNPARPRPNLRLRTKEQAKAAEKEPTETKEPIPLDDNLVKKLGELPGVIAAYPQLTLNRVDFEYGEKKHSSSAYGIAKNISRMRFAANSLKSGRFASKSDAAEAVLGHKLANSLGFEKPEDAIGKRVKVIASGPIYEEGKGFILTKKTVEVEVVGVWEPPNVPFFVSGGLGPDSMLLPVDYMKKLPGAMTGSGFEQISQLVDYKPGTYSRILVRVEEMSNVPLIESQIKAMGLHATNILDRFKELRNSFLIMDFVVGAIGTVALIVASLGIVNTMLVAVLERIKEIGLLKAVGASRTDIMTLFLTESAVIGVIGGVGGVVLGLFVSWNIEFWINRYASKFDIDSQVVSFAFPYWMIAGSVLFSILMSIVSGLIPALRAAKVDPIQALRSE